MKSHEAGRPPTSVLLAAILLVLFSLSGLLAGSLTRAVTSPDMLAGLFGPPSSRPETRGPTSPAATLPTATRTPLPTRTIEGSFTLSEHVTPQSARPGSKVYITVTAHDASGAPLGGLSVHLGPPQHGGVGLLTSWPPSTATDASGKAMWTISVPASTAAGEYTVAAYGVGATYRYYNERTIAVNA